MGQICRIKDTHLKEPGWLGAETGYELMIETNPELHSPPM